MASKKSHPVYRDSKAGRLLSKEQAARKDPAKVQRESMPNRGRGDTGRGKK